MGIFDGDKPMGADEWSLALTFRPHGKCDLGYLSGLADCIAAALKVSGSCLGKRFELQKGVLILHMQMSDDGESEMEVCQWLVDTIEKSSMSNENVGVFVDGKPIELVKED